MSENIEHVNEQRATKKLKVKVVPKIAPQVEVSKKSASVVQSDSAATSTSSDGKTKLRIRRVVSHTGIFKPTAGERSATRGIYTIKAVDGTLRLDNLKAAESGFQNWLKNSVLPTDGIEIGNTVATFLPVVQFTHKIRQTKTLVALNMLIQELNKMKDETGVVAEN